MNGHYGRDKTNEYPHTKKYASNENSNAIDSFGFLKKMGNTTVKRRNEPMRFTKNQIKIEYPNCFITKNPISYLKSKVKNAIAFINDFKIISVKKATEMKCDSIMIGHIHTPAVDRSGVINYYNTGDFCETCSFIIETVNGDIELILCK